MLDAAKGGMPLLHSKGCCIMLVNDVDVRSGWDYCLPPSFGSLRAFLILLNASPQGNVFQVSSSIGSSGLVFEGHGLLYRGLIFCLGDSQGQ